MTAPSTIAPPQDSAAVSGSDHRLVVRCPNHQQTPLNELHLFAGCGGGILGGILLGHQPCCAVEIEPYARKALLQRQRDGHLPPFPIWDDVRTFDGKPWRGIADIVCGGFPCQDISCANPNGDGLEGERSGLWSEMRRIIGEVEPQLVFVENSPMLTLRGLGDVLGDLATMGYDAAWGVLAAEHAGAPHKRERIWILADSREIRLNAGRAGESLQRTWLDGETPMVNPTWWDAEPGMDRVAHGLANGLDRIAALGNGQVPGVVVKAWQTLAARLISSHNDQALPQAGRPQNDEN